MHPVGPLLIVNRVKLLDVSIIEMQLPPQPPFLYI